jgi:thioredoxin reductase (NADPH)
MGIIGEQIVIYGITAIVIAIIVFYYMRNDRRGSHQVRQKVKKAKEEGLFEPVSLHPYIDLGRCIGSAACIEECHEKDILGIVDGKATIIQASNCIGHGACFHACPVEAISLRIGTETRGVDLPHVNPNYETNMSGVYIAGELGGMGLIKNSAEQGIQAIESIRRSNKTSNTDILDVVIVGAGPAGIAAALNAKKHGLSAVTLEQDSIGGTVYTYPRNKVVMVSPMNLPLYGKLKTYVTSKDELIRLWTKVIVENNLMIHENTRVERIIPQSDQTFKVVASTGEEYTTNHVLLAIGRRGSPRKLSIPGVESSKVAYRLIEPERIEGQHITVVGGGDSAIEAVLMLKDTNQVTLSYRKNKFARLKPRNRDQILAAIDNREIDMRYDSNVISISPESVLIQQRAEVSEVPNDLVYIFIGGELPARFLKSIGVTIQRKFGQIMKQHN